MNAERDSLATFAVFSRVLNPRTAEPRPFLFPPIAYAPSFLSLSRACSFTTFLSPPRDCSRPLRFFLGTPRARGHSLFRSRSFERVARSRRPRAKHASLNSLVSFPLICTHGLRLSPSRSLFRCGRCAYTRARRHTHTRALIHLIIALVTSFLFTRYPLFFFSSFSPSFSIQSLSRRYHVD